MKSYNQYIAENVNRKQEVNGRTFEVAYHKEPTPSQKRVITDVMVPYVKMYTKAGYDVIIRSAKDIGINSRFTLFRKKGGRSEAMVDKFISKNGKVRDAE